MISLLHSQQTDREWLVQANKTISSDNKEEIIEQSLDSLSNGVYDVELIVQNKFGSARLVSNNKVAVGKSNACSYENNFGILIVRKLHNLLFK